MKNFKDKVAVITGAGSGMGQALALQLASEGCNIALVEWKEELLNETRELLKKHNVGVSSHLLDVSDKEAVDNLPNEVIEHNGQVDIVFNNAGLSVAATVEESNDEDCCLCFPSCPRGSLCSRQPGKQTQYHGCSSSNR